jgi:ECF sigma factor
MALLYPFGSASSCRLDAAMAAAGVPQLTRMLVAWSSGDAAALDDLVPHVEGELRRLAGSYLRRERDGHLLQTTALINEAYLRLIDQRAVRWQNRAHFFGIAAQMMRRILVSMARARQADKRGGNAPMVPFPRTNGPRRSWPSTTRSRRWPRSTRAGPGWWSCATSAASAWKNPQRYCRSRPRP